jgi:hypothetical protein
MANPLSESRIEILSFTPVGAARTGETGTPISWMFKD